MIIVVTDLAAFQPYAQARWPDPLHPGHWRAPWELNSVYCVEGNQAFVRSLEVEVPADLPATVQVFSTLAQAMQAFPSLPWHRLPVFGGQTPEPELVAAVQAFVAAQQVQQGTGA